MSSQSNSRATFIGSSVGLNQFPGKSHPSWIVLLKFDELFEKVFMSDRVQLRSSSDGSNVYGFAAAVSKLPRSSEGWHSKSLEFGRFHFRVKSSSLAVLTKAVPRNLIGTGMPAVRSYVVSAKFGSSSSMKRMRWPSRITSAPLVAEI